MTNKRANGDWLRHLFSRENILMAVGVAIVLGSFVNSEVLGRTFHYEFLVLGAMFCGVSITQWGDKNH
jgi:hypothetical protein